MTRSHVFRARRGSLGSFFLRCAPGLANSGAACNSLVSNRNSVHNRVAMQTIPPTYATLFVATCSLLNLANPNRVYDENQDGYTER